MFGTRNKNLYIVYQLILRKDLPGNVELQKASFYIYFFIWFETKYKKLKKKGKIKESQSKEEEVFPYS